MKCDATQEIFEEVTLLNRRMLFTCSRIDRTTVPKGMYAYEIRHDDEGRGDPSEIGEHILVNFLGTVITNRPIKLERSKHTDNAYRTIDPEKDWGYEGIDCTLKAYMKKHPPQKEKPQGRWDER